MLPAIIIYWICWVTEMGFGSAISVREDMDNVHPDIFDSSFRLKRVREVVDDTMKTREFPKIYACGSDDSQRWYEGDPEDCSAYFQCTGTYYVHRYCHQGLLFDMEREQCNWPNIVDCDDRPLPWEKPAYHGPAHLVYHSHDDEQVDDYILPEQVEQDYSMKLSRNHRIKNKSIEKSIPSIFAKYNKENDEVSFKN